MIGTPIDSDCAAVVVLRYVTRGSRTRKEGVLETSLA